MTAFDKAWKVVKISPYERAVAEQFADPRDMAGEKWTKGGEQVIRDRHGNIQIGGGKGRQSVKGSGNIQIGGSGSVSNRGETIIVDGKVIRRDGHAHRDDAV